MKWGRNQQLYTFMCLKWAPAIKKSVTIVTDIAALFHYLIYQARPVRQMLLRLIWYLDGQRETINLASIRRALGELKRMWALVGDRCGCLRLKPCISLQWYIASSRMSHRDGIGIRILMLSTNACMISLWDDHVSVLSYQTTDTPN
jgi:hypothetical protein